MSTFGLHDVEFEIELESDRRMNELPHDFVNISYLGISNLSGTLTAGVLSHANLSQEGLEWVSITRCPLTNVSNVPYSCELYLGDIPTPEDIFPYLSSWGGLCLKIRNSSGFNNDVLEMLSVVSDDGGMLYAPHLFSLELYDCTNFSIQSLQRMVYARRQNPSDASFKYLTIRNCVPVSLEARSWFVTRALSWMVLIFVAFGMMRASGFGVIV